MRKTTSILNLILLVFLVMSCKESQPKKNIQNDQIHKEVTAKDILGNSDYLAISYGGYRKSSRDFQPTIQELKEDMKIQVPEEIFSIQKWECSVESNENVATFIKELVLNLPEGENLNFEAGGYIQIDIPEYHDLQFSDFNVEDEYHPDWDKFKIWDLVAHNDEPVFRAYSMANHPAEGNRVMLNVRIATPPPPLWNEAPPGLASSYMGWLVGLPVMIIVSLLTEHSPEENRTLFYSD